MPHEELLTAEPDVSGVLNAEGGPPPGGPPVEAPSPAAAPPEAAAGGEMGLDELLASIEATEDVAPQSQAPESQDISEMLNAIRERRGRSEVDDGTQDILTQRLKGLEQGMQNINAERDALSEQNIRNNIQATISGSIVNKLNSLNIDPEKASGKAFARVVANSAMVAVAKEQARTGKTNVDLKSVSQTANLYGKLVTTIAKELAAQIVANERRAPGGGQKQPFTPSKAPGEMSENEFDSAVMSAMKSMMS